MNVLEKIKQTVGFKNTDRKLLRQLSNIEMNMIVATSKCGIIGANNNIPWKAPTDMAFFKQTTITHPIIMGRKTFESLGCKPLPNRFNIIVSKTYRDKNIQQFDSVVIVSSPMEAIQFILNKIEFGDQSYQWEKPFVIGGKQLYDLFQPVISTLYLSHIVMDAVPKWTDDICTLHVDTERFYQKRTLYLNDLGALDTTIDGTHSIVKYNAPMTIDWSNILRN